MDINILLKEPKMEKQVKVTIEPLAPLSMVSDLPGTYYKAQSIPDKYKLCGVFENLLGWHFSKNDRTKIAKKIKEFNHKNLMNKSYDLSQSNSGFQPLLFDFFEVGIIFKCQGINYNDLWKRSFSRMDADVHPKGTPNLDYKILRQKGWVKQEMVEQERLKKELKEAQCSGKDEIVTKIREQILPSSTSPLLLFFQKHKMSFPMFYTSPTLREYIDYEGEEIQMKLIMDSNLYSLLAASLNDNSTAYLGNSEGWIEMKIEEI